MYFILLSCLTLLLGTISCSNDNFETDLPEEAKQLSKAELLQKYSKAELIEQALSRMPQTRAENNRVRMVTIKDSITIRYSATEAMSMQINGCTETPMEKGTDMICGYKFSDDNLSHVVEIRGSQLAIQSLNVDDNALIDLKIYSNENLTTLSCMNNYLDKLDLTGCLGLKYFYASNNEFSAIDVTYLEDLQILEAKNNQLMALDLSENEKLFSLWLGNNQITALNTSNNPDLSVLYLENNLLQELDLSKNTLLTCLDVSFNFIKDLDLSNNIDLMIINMERVPIKILNNHLINDTSFAKFSILWQLNVAYTSFDSLDLSNNSILQDVDISGSTITQLNISNIRVRSLYATRSKLTNLIWGQNGLNNLYELRIESTPFEKVWDNINTLSGDLPKRSETNPGHLYTYSPHIDLLKINRNDYWLINQ